MESRLKEHYFDPINTRYVKVQGIERATEYGYSIYELEVYEAKEVIEANKTGLQIAIEMAKKSDLENVVPVVVTELNEALTNVKEVYAKTNAAQSEVDNAKDVLIKAIAGLEVNSGDVISSVKTGDTINLIYALVRLIVTSIVLFENMKRRVNG